MKSFKRLIALTLALWVVLSFVGCHKKNEVAVTIGDVEFDGGLKGRGVVAGYPRPSGNNAVGKVVVSVVVNSEGRVESATVRGQGTTTTDPTLRANAVNAARKTKFKPDSLRMTQTGTITYKYIVN